MPTSNHFHSFAELSTHLESLGLFRIRPELGKFQEVFALLLLRKPRAVVQIVGTNGKGSTATFIASLAEAHGLRAGLYTSPHFVSFRERIRINGIQAGEDVLLEAANRIMAVGGEKLTYFEFVTILAALVFSPETGKAVDVAVMETGLGGSWDAVTALPVDMVAFTPIGLDHCDILGDTVRAVALDKAGAIRPGLPVYSAPQSADAMAALRETAAAQDTPFSLAGGRESLPPPVRDGHVSLGLAGEHQYDNAGLALAVWRNMAAAHGWPVSEAKETDALASAFIPGRMQFVPASPKYGHPALLLDGAHNAHGMAALGKNLAAKGIAPAAVIFSCLADKHPEELAAHLRVLATGPIFIPPIAHNPRAAHPAALAEAVGLAAVPVPSMAQALARAAAHVAGYMSKEAAANPERHPVLVCGSLYMLGDFFALRPDCLEKQTV